MMESTTHFCKVDLTLDIARLTRALLYQWIGTWPFKIYQTHSNPKQLTWNWMHFQMLIVVEKLAMKGKIITQLKIE